MRAAVEISIQTKGKADIGIISKVQVMRSHSVCAEGGTAAVMLSVRVKGIYLWTEGGFFHQPIFRLGELCVVAAFAFHAFNGIRLVLVELGFAVGNPIEPIYPYKTSVRVQRPLLIAVMLLAFVFLLVGGYNFLGLAKYEMR